MILRLDIDQGRRPLTIGRLCWLLRRAGYRVVWLSQVRSPSLKGWHCEALLSPEPQTAIEVTALQAICGSDAAREACNLTRARHVDRGTVSPYWVERFNVLYG